MKTFGIILGLGFAMWMIASFGCTPSPVQPQRYVGEPSNNKPVIGDPMRNWNPNNMFNPMRKFDPTPALDGPFK